MTCKDAPPLLPSQKRTYQVQPRADAPTRLVALEDGQPARFLLHVPIFCPTGFGLDGAAACDTALAVLADAFGEVVSPTAVALGQARCCRLYLLLAVRLRQLHGHTGLTMTFLEQQREATDVPFDGVIL